MLQTSPIVMACHLVSENIWFDRSRVEEAEATFYCRKYSGKSASESTSANTVSVSVYFFALVWSLFIVCMVLYGINAVLCVCSYFGLVFCRLPLLCLTSTI